MKAKIFLVCFVFIFCFNGVKPQATYKGLKGVYKTCQSVNKLEICGKQIIEIYDRMSTKWKDKICFNFDDKPFIVYTRLSVMFKNWYKFDYNKYRQQEQLSDENKMMLAFTSNHSCPE